MGMRPPVPLGSEPGSRQQRSSLPPQGWQLLSVELATGRQRVSGAVQVSLQQGWLTPPQVPSAHEPALQLPVNPWQLVLVERHTPRTQQPSRQLLMPQQGWLFMPQGWHVVGLLPSLSQTAAPVEQ